MVELSGASPGVDARLAWWRRALAWLAPHWSGQPEGEATSPQSRGLPESGARYATRPANTGAQGPLTDAHAAVEALYRAHALSVLSYLYHRLPTQADAEDALAEVFLAALRASADGAAPNILWLMGAARNRVADFYRVASRRAFANAPLNLAEGERNPLASPEEQMLRAEERHQLVTLVGTLPSEQQEALLLRFGSGLRSAQIAALLGKTDEATRALISRALRTLRKEWRA